MSPTSGLNVLVAEDRAEDAAALRTILRRSGHHVRVAPDGEAALREAIEDPPQVMLLDIDMPKLDGCEVARAVRSVAWPERPLVATITGHDADEYRRRAAAAGVDLYLVKPISAEALRTLLGRLTTQAGPPIDAGHPAATALVCRSCGTETPVARSLAGRGVCCPHCLAPLSVPDIPAGRCGANRTNAWEDD
jgi:CheY-like chemotaxis protein